VEKSDREKRELEEILDLISQMEEEEDQVNVGASTSKVSNVNCEHLFSSE
jgi:hypothetical protein